MIAPSSVVKKTARTFLLQKPLKSIVVCSVLVFAFLIAELTASLASSFAGIIGYIAVMCALLLFGIFPLCMGVVYYFFRLIFAQDDSVFIIFKYFSNIAEYKRIMSMIRLTAIRVLSVGGILFLPCIIVWLLSTEKLYLLLDIPLPIWASNLWALNSLLAFLASLALLFVMLKYYLAAFIFTCNESIKPIEALNMSVIISKRTGSDFFGLLLSFTGWLLLSFLVAPLIFTLPYFLASYCVHCRYAITAYNCDVDRFNAVMTPSYSSDEI